jgi:RNA polymerase sigma factor (TIGR02999 family)
MLPAMGTSSRGRAMGLLTADGEDPAAAIDVVFPEIYDELRAIARRQLARESGNATLNATAVVHEVYMLLVDQTRVTSRGRAYFFAAAARAMRCVLVDAARRRKALKRGGGADPITLVDHQVAVDGFAAELLDLDEALDRLAREHPRPARVVEHRFFGGLSSEETAEALGVSKRTVKYDWALARAWLHRALGPDGAGSEIAPED